jgi:serine/threonine protein kinase
MPKTLDPNRWKQIEGLFYAAAELSPEARAEFLKQQSNGDQELLDEVISLLGALSGSEGFLEQPVSQIVREIAAEQTRDRLVEGSHFLQYEVVRKIGAGGMGHVYLACDTRLRRQVALKVLAPYLTYDVPALRRFEQEAHAASALNHPNILTIFEFGEFEGLHYMASEFIDGPTLRQKLQQGPLDVASAVNIAIQIANALVAAHDSGIIHRDIKPENILVRGDGLVKLVDFGVAKLGEGNADTRLAGSPRQDAPDQLGQTLPGTVVGTIRYMSPEQARELPVDGRSDLFTVGSVLYEMLAGTPAFSGDDFDEIAQRIVAVDPLPLRDFGAELPPELELIVEKALRKEKEARYQTARDLLVDLKQFQKKLEFEANLIRAGFTPSGNLRPRVLGETPSGSSSSGRAKSGPQLATPAQQSAKPAAARRVLWGIFAAVALVIAVVAAFLLMRRPESTSITQHPRSIAILPFRNLNRDPGTDFLQVSLSDALINKLSYVKALTVRPSSAVDGFRNSSDSDLRQIASQLRVDLLLTGSYVKEGNQLQIDTQMIDALPGTVLWQRSIKLPYDQLLTVQDRLAQQVIDGLSLKLSAGESQRIALDRPANTMAYEYYLRGVDLYALNEFDQAIDMLKKSIALEPDYAMAWAQLGRAYTTHASLQFGGREQYVLARAAYEKALSLDPGMVDVRIYMANLLTDTGRVEEAVPLLKEALTANPNSAEAHWELGYAYRFGGLLDQSAAEAEQARRLDPEVKINSSAINAYLYRGEYRKFLDSVPANSSGYALFYRGLAEYYLKNYPAAEDYFDRAYAEDKNILPAPIGKALSDGLKHHPEDGLKLLHDTETRFNAQGVSDPEMLYKLTQAYAVLGDAASALRVLQQSVDGGFFCAPYMAKDPLIDSLRGLPKFCELAGHVDARHSQFLVRFGKGHTP